MHYCEKYIFNKRHFKRRFSSNVVAFHKIHTVTLPRIKWVLKMNEHDEVKVAGILFSGEW